MWTKVIIVLAANLLFFSVFFIIWYVSKLMPRWEAKQVARQQDLLKARTEQAAKEEEE